MMETTSLLQRVAATGAVFCAFPQENKVVVRPASAIPPQLAVDIRARKERLMETIVQNGIEWYGTYYAWTLATLACNKL
jgi:hypothetical protein